MSELLEVFVLSYNRVDYLKECLISILNQTCKDFRIIVLDNASEQDVAGMVNGLKNNRIELIVNASNIGGLANVHKALDLARAKHVVLFHDDDCMHPKLLETQLGLFQKQPDLSYVTVNSRFVQDPSLMNIFTDEVDASADFFHLPCDVLAAYFGGGVVGFGSTMYRTDIVKIVKPDAERFANVADRPYLIELTKYGPGARIIDSAYYNVRSHPGQDSLARGWTYLNEIEAARYFMDVAGVADAKRFRPKILKSLVQQYAVRCQRVRLDIWLRELEKRRLLYKMQLLKYLPFYLFRDTLIRLFKAVAPGLYNQLAWRKLRLKSK